MRPNRQSRVTVEMSIKGTRYADESWDLPKAPKHLRATAHRGRGYGVPVWHLADLRRCEDRAIFGELGRSAESSPTRTSLSDALSAICLYHAATQRANAETRPALPTRTDSVRQHGDTLPSRVSGGSRPDVSQHDSR